MGQNVALNKTATSFSYIKPYNNMTRAEVVAVVLRLFQQSGLVDIRSKV